MTTAEIAPSTSKTITATADPRFALATGNWDGFYQGKRTLELRSDLTGTMVSEPEGLAATLLAAKLTFHITWKLEGDQVVFETTRGEPASKVDLITRMYGKQRKHKLLKLADDEMLLLDEDGKTEYRWTRRAP